MAAADYYLKIDGIEGESQDSKHAGEMQIDSFSWGESNVGSSGQGGGSGSGKVSMHDFSFSIMNGKHSPKLLLACASGQPAAKAILTVRKAGGQQEEYLTYTFTDVLISSFTTSGSARGDLLPMDSCSFNFTKVETEYKEQKPDGTLGGTTKAGWDVKKNAKV